MSANRHSFEERFRTLKAKYAEELPVRFAHLRTLWSAVMEADDDEALAELVRESHTLAGSGTTFGYPAVTELARELETLLRPHAEAKTRPHEEERARVAELLTSLDGICEETHDSGTETSSPHALDSGEVRVDILSSDAELHDELGSQLGQFQYRVTAFTDPEALFEAVSRRAPAVILLDRDMPAVGDAMTDMMERIHRQSSGHSQIIVISSSDAFAPRLEAARANAQAWITRPVDIARLVDTIDRIVTPMPSEPFRVMVVDDDPDTRNFICFTLEQHGMRVLPVARAEEVMECMREFGPELVLTDLYMPECSGLELARVIRQHDAYLGIPIVYLSGETDVDKQMQALSEGADDFLTKPITPRKLITRISNRIRRYRGLSSLLSRDGLTGLLNHSTFKERLHHEALRADRQDSFFSYVMIDIDHFKNINDTRGHATGDRVIKYIARLLSRRLRKSDIIGRYGGEEFAIILPDTAIEDAERLVNRLREDYAQLQHRDDRGNGFTTTFSAGVAQYPDFDDVQRVHAAADEALYLAKQQGRNRVVLRRSGDEL